MSNKKYLIIGIIILAIAAGAVFWSRDNSSTPDASVLEKGVKNLTRESAAAMIKTYLELNPPYPKTRQFSYNEQLGHYSEKGYSADDIKLIKALAEAGYVTIIEEKPTQWTSTKVDYISYDLTEQAKPYFVKQENVASDNKNVEVLLGEVVSVEVTGITEPAQGLGGNVRVANYTAKYEATPIGKIVDEKNAGEEAKSQMPFQLYDDGWRIAQ